MALANVVPLSRTFEAAVPVSRLWSLATASGRLVELSGDASAPLLTLAFALVLEAQRDGDPAAWITGEDSCFFPPDAQAGGVDLRAMPVVRVSDDRQMARAAEQLLRSGAFALVVLDLGRGDVSLPMQTRLAGLAHKHESAVLCLTEKRRDAPSLGSLVSLRGEALRTRTRSGRYRCELRILKDKRGSPGWTHSEVCHGSEGMR